MSIQDWNSLHTVTRVMNAIIAGIVSGIAYLNLCKRILFL
jgi:hypothetical protein